MFLADRRADLVGHHAVDADIVGRELDRHRARHVGDAALGRRIGDGAVASVIARRRGHVDDLAPGTGRDHCLGGMFCKQEGRSQRDRNGAVPFLGGDVEHVLVVGNGDIVDENVEAAEGCRHRCHCRINVALLGDVADEGLCLAACRIDLGRHALGALTVEIDDGDAGAFARESLGDLFANVAAGAGDDGCLSLKFHLSLPDLLMCQHGAARFRFHQLYNRRSGVWRQRRNRAAPRPSSHSLRADRAAPARCRAETRWRSRRRRACRA